jgi:membrane-bound serine protease (ClpP class)
MRKVIKILAILTTVGLAQSTEIHKITIDGSINPVSAKFLENAIVRAEKSADLLLVQLDTPGGLLESTRSMVKKMLPAEVPIVVYIAPSGARAGSAGVFITLASHIAVMAPGTNIGAAHPVSLGEAIDSIMNKKATNDAVAFARSIAAERKRNQEWAESAVRESAAIPVNEAVQKGIVDFVAKDIPDLLAQLEGRKVMLPGGEITLSTKEYHITEFKMSTRERILNKLSDPNIAYILMMLGMYGLIFELYNPGSILPGIVGGICLIIAFFALQTLPVNAAGLLLIIFAIILFLLEIKVVSHGMLTIGGVVSLLLGSLMLFKGDPFSGYEIRVSWEVIIPVVVVTVLFFLIAIAYSIKAQKRRPDYGREALIGMEAMVVEELKPEGLVRVEGELWRAVADNPHSVGERLKVVEIHGMQLKVG